MAYNSETALATATRLNSLANNSAVCLELIDFGTDPPHDAKIHIAITLASSGLSSTGYLNIYFPTSLDGTNLTDNIDPTIATNQASLIQAVKQISSPDANVASDVVRETIDLRKFINGIVRYGAVLIENKSGAALAASGHAVSWQSFFYKPAT